MDSLRDLSAFLGRRRPRPWGLAVAVALGVLLGAGCTTREIVPVEIGVVTLLPNLASLVDGQQLQFVAIVTDSDGSPLPGAVVSWTTDPPSVASIDSTGVLRALSAGTARVYASFRGVEGTATVSVLPGPKLVLGQDSVAIGAAVGGPSPAPVTIPITVEGLGTISGLAAATEFASGEPTGWLTATLAGTTAPTSLTLSTQTSSLGVGVYHASVLIDSDLDIGTTRLAVTLVVTQGGVKVVESGGSTSVTEAGSRDTLTVVLETMPTSNVVLDILSADETEVTVSPSRLTFTPSSWNVPQTVTVTGRNDSLLDGNVVTEVSVAVVDALSDPTYAEVPSTTVLVTTVDDEQPSFKVTESGDRTRMREGSSDDIHVVLGVGPISDVVIDVVSSDLGEATVSPARLIFTPANWAQAQTVKVSGVRDNVKDGTQTVLVTFSVNDALSGAAWASVPDQVVDVVVLDRD